MTHTPPPLAHLHEALAALERDGLLRKPPPPQPGAALSFCSNDYLGLAQRLGPPAETGAGASRLVAGERPAHGALERALSAWLGLQASLLFPSGYAANLGTVAALAGPGDVIVSDALNHASLIDGARLSRARVVVTPHNDLDAIATALSARAEARAWVLVESYYSMDSDGPDLRRLRSICDNHGAALLVDEAHALGVLGPEGRGRCAEAEIQPDIFVGTFGKAFGTQGAFVAGCHALRDWLWNRARSFVFSTGLAPTLTAAAHQALLHVQAAAHDRAKVAILSERLRVGLSTAPQLHLIGFGHIVPALVGRTDRAVQLATNLIDEGFWVPAIRPPTVPRDTARLRFTVSARHEASDIDRLVAAVHRALRRSP